MSTFSQLIEIFEWTRICSKMSKNKNLNVSKVYKFDKQQKIFVETTYNKIALAFDLQLFLHISYLFGEQTFASIFDAIAPTILYIL